MARKFHESLNVNADPVVRTKASKYDVDMSRRSFVVVLESNFENVKPSSLPGLQSLS